MSTLAHLSSNQFITTRLVATTGFKQEYSTVTGVKGNLQPASPTKTELFAGVMGKTFTMYIDGTVDVLELDRFRDIDTGFIYQVMNGGVSRRTMGAIDYSEVTVQQIS